MDSVVATNGQGHNNSRKLVTVTFIVLLLLGLTGFIISVKLLVDAGKVSPSVPATPVDSALKSPVLSQPKFPAKNGIIMMHQNGSKYKYETINTVAMEFASMVVVHGCFSVVGTDHSPSAPIPFPSTTTTTTTDIPRFTPGILNTSTYVVALLKDVSRPKTTLIGNGSVFRDYSFGVFGNGPLREPTAQIGVYLDTDGLIYFDTYLRHNDIVEFNFIYNPQFTVIKRFGQDGGGVQSAESRALSTMTDLSTGCIQ